MKRIIPCLDIKDGKTVKGVNFVAIKDVGDPVEMAKHYDQNGADELVLLDITATNENRKTRSDLISKIANSISIPLTVGGGISSVEDARLLFDANVKKVSINTAAVHNPQLVQKLANEFGSQAVVVAIDTKLKNNTWYVHTNGGKVATEIKTIEWAKEVVRLGAGEILLTSMSHDGTKSGFAADITNAVAEAVDVPVIASGGAGSAEDFVHILKNSKIDAALAAGIFHYGEVKIPDLKRLLKQEGIDVKI